MINKLVFTFISTSWVWVVYAIQCKWSFIFNSHTLTSIAMVLVPFLLTIVWLYVARLFSVENLSGCEDVDEAQYDFLANFLGCVFIGVGLDDFYVLLMIYLIITFLTYAAQNKCFNPVLLIFRYKYYNVTTTEGAKAFIITKRKLRNADEVEFNNLRRINDMTYIEIGR